MKRFLKFLSIEEQESEYLMNTVLTFLGNYDLSIEDCRGQRYDNAANMFGKYSGLEARIKEICEFTTFVPTAARYFNLVGLHTAECLQGTTSFFNNSEIIQFFFEFGELN